MESRYGVGINNRYALFLDEDMEGEEIDGVLTPKKPVLPNENKKVIKEQPAKTTDTKKNAPNKDNKNNKTTDATKTNKEGKNFSRCALCLCDHKKVNCCLALILQRCYTCDRRTGRGLFAVTPEFVLNDGPSDGRRDPSSD